MMLMIMSNVERARLGFGVTVRRWEVVVAKSPPLRKYHGQKAESGTSGTSGGKKEKEKEKEKGTQTQ